MSKTFTALRDLVFGDIIYVNLYINKKDMADPNSQSTTAKKIKSGKPVTRMSVVLVAGSLSVQVTHLATFEESTQLPTTFVDKTMWYPISPATKESTYDLLPALQNNTAQWACLRQNRQSLPTRPPSWMVVA
ncbi:hypothetical protein BC826DRAFT_1184072 [Russula brevipes]|nr:hypothetical protein BC826DRAFT_1184072 [Russula brevipes]